VAVHIEFGFVRTVCIAWFFFSTSFGELGREGTREQGWFCRVKLISWLE
jgi:hypothetical protein